MSTEISLSPNLVNQIAVLQNVVEESKAGIKAAIVNRARMQVPFIRARAVRELEKAITDELLTDIVALQNHPMGFKTDRQPGKSSPYSKAELRPVVVQALSMGASFDGNEFNVLAGNLYLTKEYYSRQCKDVGVRELKVHLGSPARQKFDEKSFLFLVAASATWRFADRLMSLEWDVIEGESDNRLIVKGYSTSSIDEIHGKCRRRVLKAIFEEVSGISLEEETDDDPPLEGQFEKGNETQAPRIQSGENQMSLPLDPHVREHLEKFLGVIQKKVEAAGSDTSKLDEIHGVATSQIDEKPWPLPTAAEAKRRVSEMCRIAAELIRSGKRESK